MGKFKRLIGKAIDGVLYSTLILLSANTINELVLTGKIATGDYKTATQINADAALFDATANIPEGKQMSDYLRLKHNDGKPIYVYIDQSISESDEELIKQTLDYYETIFKDINDKYFFEIVGKQTYDINTLKGDTTIKYQMEDLTRFGADGVNRSNRIMFNHKFIKNSTIGINPSLSQDPEYRYYVFLHELTHTFGLNDVYYFGPNASHDTYFGNTILQASILQQVMGRLSPEDYKMLHAMYNSKHLEKEADTQAAINTILANIEQYNQDYYHFMVDKVKQNLNMHRGKTFQEVIDAEIARLDVVYKNSLYNSNQLQDKYEYRVEFENGLYKWQSYKNDQLLHETSGTYLEEGNIIIIPNLKLQEPSFAVSYLGKVNKAVVTVGFAKQNNTYYMIPIDTLAQMPMSLGQTASLNNNVSMPNGDISQTLAAQEGQNEVIYQTGQYQFVVPKTLSDSLKSSREQ